jgi:hypothetical protein
VTIPFVHIAALTAIVAITVPGFVQAIRALPPVTRWVEAGIKPWACDICMPFWSTGLWVGAVAYLAQEPWLMLACGPAYTLSMMLLEYIQRPPPGSGPIPDEPPEADDGLASRLEGED